jgi:hypothetical protein
MLCAMTKIAELPGSTFEQLRERKSNGADLLLRRGAYTFDDFSPGMRPQYRANVSQRALEETAHSGRE